MCKSCENSVGVAGTDMGISRFFPTAVSLKFNELRINRFYAQLIQAFTRIVMHIKFSLNRSVNLFFSTVSTILTIKSTKLNLDEIVIIQARSQTT